MIGEVDAVRQIADTADAPYNAAKALWQRTWLPRLFFELAQCERSPSIEANVFCSPRRAFFHGGKYLFGIILHGFNQLLRFRSLIRLHLPKIPSSKYKYTFSFKITGVRAIGILFNIEEYHGAIKIFSRVYLFN